MSDTLQTEHPADICLLLRVHAEQRWLICEVLPPLRQLEQPAEEMTPLGQDAALAYLEALWLEAGLRATETDAAATRLSTAGEGGTETLTETADRYHAAVRGLRRNIDLRVRRLTVARAELAAGEAPGAEPIA